MYAYTERRVQYDLNGHKCHSKQFWEAAIAKTHHRRVCNHARGHYPHHLKHMQQQLAKIDANSPETYFVSYFVCDY